MLGYYPDRERSTQGRRQYGYAQFTLLTGITATRRSPEANKRLEELRRKFGQIQPEAPKPMKMEPVPPPIPEHAAEKMSDKQWLSAICQYDDDWHGLEQDDHFTGGAVQLSRILESEVKQDPRRFAELVSEFPNDANPSYFEAVLRGISDANLDLETIVRVCERCHRIEGRPLGRVICEPIANATNGDVPPKALDLVALVRSRGPGPQPGTLANPGSPWRRFLLRGRHLYSRHQHGSWQSRTGSCETD